MSKKAYSRQEIFDIIQDTFRDFVLVATYTDVDQNGELEVGDFLAYSKNKSCCIGLAECAKDRLKDIYRKQEWDNDEN